MSFSHEFDSRRIVLKTGVYAGSQHIAGGRQMHVCPTGVKQRDVFGVAIRIA